MDANRFDDVVRAFSGASRRGLAWVLLAAALAGPLGSLADMGEAAAKKKKQKKKKKTTLGLDGQTIQASKKQKKKLLKSGATPGACPASPPPGCMPNCDRKICGDDGCGSSCGQCGLCQECRDGRCEAKATDSACGGGCKECQGGRCVNKPNGTQCATEITFRCRDGVCNTLPECDSLSKPCTDWGCCFQDPGDLCPISGTCDEKSVDGHRCRFDSDCASDNCVGFICDPA